VKTALNTAINTFREWNNLKVPKEELYRSYREVALKVSYKYSTDLIKETIDKWLNNDITTAQIRAILYSLPVRTYRLDSPLDYAWCSIDSMEQGLSCIIHINVMEGVPIPIVLTMGSALHAERCVSEKEEDLERSRQTRILEEVGIKLMRIHLT